MELEVFKDSGPIGIAVYLLMDKIYAFIKMRRNGKNGNGYPVWLVQGITEMKAEMKRHTKLLEELCSKS